MRIAYGRAARAAFGAALWIGLATLMYAALRWLGFATGPFDLFGEFFSTIAALFKAAGAIIDGAGASGLLLLAPGRPGGGGVALFAIGVFLRLVELLAWGAGIAIAVRAYVILRQGDFPYERPQ